MAELTAPPSISISAPGVPPAVFDDTAADALSLVLELLSDILGPSSDASLSVLPHRDTQAYHLVSSDRAEYLDAVQDQDGCGPKCDALADACETGGPLPDDRWPRLSATAGTLGVRFAWSVPVDPAEPARGTLSVYLGQPVGWGDPPVATARLAARLAGSLVSYSGTVAALNRGNDTLQQALETRTVIGQAQGILMARQGIDSTAAFDILRRASQRSNRKLRDIASELVAGVGRCSPRPGAPQQGL